MSREHERVIVGDEPIRICHTTNDRVPFITNVGDSPVMLDIAKWPMEHGLTLQPGVTVSFPCPLPGRTDVVPIFAMAMAPNGKGEVEYLFLR